MAGACLPILPCAREVPDLYGAMLALYGGMNLRGENGGGIPVFANKYRSKAMELFSD